MKINRRNKRVWLAALGVFVAVFLFTFLTAKFKGDEDVDAANLANFDAGYIMSDYQMGNYNSMSEADIQRFLTAKNPCNNTDYNSYVSMTNRYPGYSWHWANGHFICISEERFGDGEVIGSGDTAAHIIWQAAQDYRINPQVLIVLLQKEQGLITDTFPHNRQYRAATGYGCPDTAACSSQYYGFKNQVRKAAAMFRTVLDGGWTNYPLGWNYVQYNPNSACGGSWINIRSLATSALYRYTPYQPNASALAAGYGTGDTCGAYGNRNFYNYFEDWFGGITSTQNSTRIVEGEYYIQPVEDSSLVLSMINGESRDGANVSLRYKDDVMNYGWKVIYNSATSDYSIIDVRSGKSLDVYNAEIKDGTNVQLWTNNDTCAQRWKIIRIDGDRVKILSACSYKALDVSAGFIKDGNNIQIWADNDTNAQRWRFVPVSNIQEGMYHIASSIDDSKMIDISGGSQVAKDGTNVHLWKQNYTAAQQWYISKDSDGYYMIKNLQSGKYLDVAGAGVKNGTNMQVWTGNNTCAQKWRIMRKGDYYEFISACSMKVLDLKDSDVTPGTNIQLHGANDMNAQKWVLKSINKINDGDYNVVSMVSGGKVVDIAGNQKGDGVNVQIYENNGTSAQKWRITYNKSDGYYTIYNKGVEKALDVRWGARKNGTNVQMWEKNTTCAQKWLIEDTGNGFGISSACSGLMLDVAGGKNINGTNIQLYEPNDTNAQRWILR
ncbi:RICIN domain-containing protein [Candidatus Saccharibacteria bacterium]|nr:RICIN domain-containing protein [Candidatus Saccharibacteria bacterium]